MEAAWAVVAAVSARAEKCVSPFSHYKPTADLTSLTLLTEPSLGTGGGSRGTGNLGPVGPYPIRFLLPVKPLGRLQLQIFTEGYGL